MHNIEIENEVMDNKLINKEKFYEKYHRGIHYKTMNFSQFPVVKMYLVKIKKNTGDGFMINDVFCVADWKNYLKLFIMLAMEWSMSTIMFF